MAGESPTPPEQPAAPASEPGRGPGRAPGPRPRPDRRSPTAGGVGGWIAFGALVVVLLGVVGVSMAGGSSTSSTPKLCSSTASEALDPNSVVRVLPNAPELEYTELPPTSGAFVVGPDIPKISPDELRPPVQVGLLAQGRVLLQYQPDSLSADDLQLLRSLSGDSVIVAPNSDLKTPIVATAWRKRMTCTAVDASALKKFATVNADRAPADLSATTTTGG